MRSAGGVTVVTSSHGNCEAMRKPTGDVDRAPTSNPVPVHVIGDSRVVDLKSDGTLADVAPTLLGLLGLPKPVEMTGVDLRRG